jgi:DNA modification methylase
MILQADAFALPFGDGVFDVVIADPPYDVPSPQRGARRAHAGYIEFVSRDWWREAWRVLNHEGHLYIFGVISEIGPWWAEIGPATDVLAWIAPNAKGFGSMVRRSAGGRVVSRHGVQSCIGRRVRGSRGRPEHLSSPTTSSKARLRHR